MAITVTNESGSDYILPGRKIIPSGLTVVLSDLEFITIPISKRGVGQINPAPPLLFAPISQGAPGAAAVVGGVVGKRIAVVSYVFTVDADGTAKFTDDSDDLSGAFDVSATGGVAAIGTAESPLMQTALGSALNVETTVGKASGHISYLLTE